MKVRRRRHTRALGANRKAQQTELFNQWTLGHLAAGALIGFARVPWWGALLMSVSWEAAEHPLKDAYPSLFPTGQDTTASSVGDVIGFMLGWGVAKILVCR